MSKSAVHRAPLESLVPSSIGTPGLEEKPGIVILKFENDDPEYPNNWSMGRKSYVVGALIVATINANMGSALTANATPNISKTFHVTSQMELVLPISLFLMGFVFGPIFFAPLSEYFCRRAVLLPTFALFTLFTLGCAVVKSWPGFLILRFLAGLNGSPVMSMMGGMLADMFDDGVARGRALALWSAATLYGPLMAPVVSGFIAPWNWRWIFWTALILAGATFIALIFIPETLASDILHQRAKKMRKQTGNPNIIAPVELEDRSIKELLLTTMTRPLRMLYTELIVIASSAYMSFTYAIFYMLFEGFPVIFQGVYGLSPGVSGLMFLPMSFGACLAIGSFIWYDGYYARLRRNNPNLQEEYRRLPLACFGGPFFVIALFWLGWTARPSIHWAVPMLASVPFGFGFQLIFMALMNYLTDAYGIYAASALAATAIARCTVGALLPLSAHRMFDTLGIHWAYTMLACICILLVMVPFAFIFYGEKIRAGSSFSNMLARRGEISRDALEEV